MKNTKRALLASALSVLLCISMLVGSTFAWFTDSATTAVNTIQSGKLDVVLEMWDGEKWVDAEGETLEFVKGAMGKDQAVIWEPGCTYQLPKLRISNAGNLALKFDVAITGIGGDAKLNEVIDWTYSYTSDMAMGADPTDLSEVSIIKHGNGYPLLPADKADQANNISYAYLTISGHMLETAGNEYQDLTIDGISITVLATQYTYENDSNNKLYDIDAEYPEAPIVITDIKEVEADATWYDANAEELVIADAADLKAYFETAYTWGVANKPEVPNFKGQTIVLQSDIYLNGCLWTSISPYDSSYNGNGGFQGTFDGNGHTIYDLQVTHVNDTGRGYVLGLFGDVGDGAVFKNLTIDGVNIYAGNSNAGALVGHAHGNVTFENITVRNATIRQGRQAGGIVGIINGNGTQVTFNNCTVENSAVLTIHNDQQGPLYGYVDTNGGASVTLNNCTVNNVVEHYFKDADGNQDWNTYQYITLEEALEAYKDEPASNDN